MHCARGPRRKIPSARCGVTRTTAGVQSSALPRNLKNRKLHMPNSFGISRSTSERCAQRQAEGHRQSDRFVGVPVRMNNCGFTSVRRQQAEVVRNRIFARISASSISAWQKDCRGTRVACLRHRWFRSTEVSGARNLHVPLAAIHLGSPPPEMLSMHRGGHHAKDTFNGNDRNGDGLGRKCRARACAASGTACSRHLAESKHLLRTELRGPEPLALQLDSALWTLSFQARL
jgi:hypothetical protein